MKAEQIAPGLYRIDTGISNAFLIEAEDGCTLIDTGYPKNEGKILSAVQELGKRPNDIRHILLTHAHPDHIGSLRALEAATSARTYIHPADADIARSGTGFRPLKPAPGVINWLFVQIIGRKNRTMKVGKSRIDVEVQDGEVLPVAGGLTAIHTPGHCAGHLAFLWPRHGGVLLAGDACGNMFGLDWSVGYEDMAEGERSLRKLATHSFQIACFGHGKPLTKGADKLWRERWLRNAA